MITTSESNNNSLESVEQFLMSPSNASQEMESEHASIEMHDTINNSHNNNENENESDINNDSTNNSVEEMEDEESKKEKCEDVVLHRSPDVKSDNVVECCEISFFSPYVVLCYLIFYTFSLS